MELIYLDFPINMGNNEYIMYFKHLNNIGFLPIKENIEGVKNITHFFLHTHADYLRVCKNILQDPSVLGVPQLISCLNIEDKTFYIKFREKEMMTSFTDFVNKIVPQFSLIGEKWSDPYLQRLGVLDHCNELIQINNNIIAQKNCGANTVAEALSRSFDKEAMDLFLILEEWTRNRKELKEERIQTFIEKQEGK